MLLSTKHLAMTLILRKMQEDNKKQRNGADPRTLTCYWITQCFAKHGTEIFYPQKTVSATSSPLFRWFALRTSIGNVYTFKSTALFFLCPFETTVLRRQEKHWLFLLSSSVFRANNFEMVNHFNKDACIMVVTRFNGRPEIPHTVLRDSDSMLLSNQNYALNCGIIQLCDWMV